MKYTNNLGLPEALVRAIKNDPYSKGDADFSVTELLKPARARVLELKHENEIVVDVSTRTHSLRGQALHYILQRGAGPEDLVETRFMAMFDNTSVSGQIDLLSKCKLYDYKDTKAYPFSTKGGSGQKPEWQAQLNMQLELLRHNGLDADSLHIVGFLKDYDKKKLDPSDHRNFMAGYPKAEVVVVDIPIWPREQTQAFMRERIEAHLKARMVLPYCNLEESWNGRRCQSYCDSASFCSQFQESKSTGRLTRD